MERKEERERRGMEEGKEVRRKDEKRGGRKRRKEGNGFVPGVIVGRQ